MKRIVIAAIAAAVGTVCFVMPAGASPAGGQQDPVVAQKMAAAGGADQGKPAAPPVLTSDVGAASLANRIVQGTGATNDDLGDEGTLCNGCSFWEGNYAGFWQAILWSEGLLSPSQVDCEFGPNTGAATRSLQSRYGLGVDGVAGPQTRSRIDDFLIASSDPAYNVYYLGTGGRLVYLFRDTTSPYNYWIYWNGQWRVIYYNQKTIVGC